MNSNGISHLYGHRRVPTLIGSILAGTLLIGDIALYVIERQLMETTGQTLALAAGEVSDKLDRIVFERRGDAKMMARAFTGRCRDTPFASAYLDWMSQAYPLYESLSVLDARGRVMTSTSAAMVGNDFSKQPWFEQVRDGRGTGVQQWESTKLAAQEVGAGVSFAAAITDSSGIFCGAVMSRVGLTVLGETVTRKWQSSSVHTMPFPSLEYQFVTSTGLDFVDSLYQADATPPNLRELAVPSFLLAESEEIGFLEETHARRQVPVVTGFARTHGYRDSANPEWTVLLRVDRSTLLAPIRTRVTFVGLLGLMGMAPLALGLLWTARRLQNIGQVAQSERMRAGAAEEATQQAVTRHRDVVNALNGIVWECDARTWRFSFVSDQAESLLGYPARRWIEEPDFWQSHIHPDDRDWVMEYCLTSSREKRKYSFEYRMMAADGHVVWLQDIVTVDADEHGPAVLRGIMVDTTARKQTETALKDSEERLRLVIQGSNDGIWDWNMTTHENYTSARWKEILGYREGEVPDTDAMFFDLLHPDDRAAVQEGLRRHLEKHAPYGIEIRMRHKDGQYRWCLTRGEAVRDVQGHPIRMVGSLADITARKQAEERLRRSEAFISSVVDNLPIMVFVKDVADLRFVRLNKAGEALLGYSHQELLGKNDYDFFPKEEADLFTAADRKVLAGGRLLDIPEEPIQTKENGIRYLHTKKIPICDADGMPQFLLGISEDITERKQTEKALQDSEARLHGIIESAMDAIITIDEDQRVVVFNAMAEKVFGWKSNEIIGLPMDVLLPLHVRSGHPALVRTFIGSDITSRTIGRLGQLTGLRATGEEFPAEASISKTTVGGRTYCSVILRDITARRRNEVALIARARQQAAVAQLGLHALLMHDTDLVLHEATRLVTEALEADFCKVLELLPAGDIFLLRAGTGWQEGMVGSARVSASLDSQAGYTLTSRVPVVVQELRSETRFSGSPLLHQHGVVSGMSAVIYSNGRSWGVLGVHTTAQRPFGQDDVHFLQAIANVLGATLERQGAEQALRQSELLLRASLDERERMALNLHDGVIQSLFAMGLTLRESQELIGENSEAARAQLGQGLVALKAVIRELRESIIGGVPIVRSGRRFQETLTDLVVAAQGPRGLVFQVTLDPEALAHLAGDTEEHLLFIVREAVSNAQRHSRGTSGRVTLTTHEGEVRLVIEDDGEGFDRRQVSGNGLGLSNISVRAERLGARCEVVSDIGKGVRIVVDLPCKEAACKG